MGSFQTLFDEKRKDKLQLRRAVYKYHRTEKYSFQHGTFLNLIALKIQ